MNNMYLAMIVILWELLDNDNGIYNEYTNYGVRTKCYNSVAVNGDNNYCSKHCNRWGHMLLCRNCMFTGFCRCSKAVAAHYILVALAIYLFTKVPSPSELDST